MTTEGANDERGKVGLRRKLLPVLDAGVDSGQIDRDEALRVMDTIADSADLRAERDRQWERAVLRAACDHQRKVTDGGACWCGGWPNADHSTTWMEHLAEGVRGALASTDRHDGVRGGGTDG